MSKNALKQAAIFFGLTLGLSYLVFWGPLAVLGVRVGNFVSGGAQPQAWAMILYIIGGFVPSLVALVLTRVWEGGAGLKQLLKRALQFKLGARAYIGTIVMVVLITAGQIATQAAMGHTFNLSLFGQQIASFVPLLILGPISEEFGWRGFALERLQKRWSALVSALVVGVMWGLWHLPLFFMNGTSQNVLKMPFFGFLLGVTAMSVLMTWVYNESKGSIWGAIFFHWIYTYCMQVSATGAVRSPLYNWLEYTPSVLIALVLVAANWKRFAEAPKPEKKVKAKLAVARSR